MIIGHHVIFGAYGFWLPNDPRGSWSDFVGAWNLFRYGGPATKTTETRSQARIEHDDEVRLGVKKALKRPAVEFTGIQARAIGRGFADYAEKSGLVIWACAILPSHIHLVVRQEKQDIEQTVIQLKGAATERLVEEGLHPFQDILEPHSSGQPRRPKCFARGEWKVFLDVDDAPRAVQYVEENPVKEGKPPQRWRFVTPLGNSLG